MFWDYLQTQGTSIQLIICMQKNFSYNANNDNLYIKELISVI